MGRVQRFPTLLFLPLTSDQPFVVGDEQDASAVLAFLRKHRTPSAEVGSRPPRPRPLWQAAQPDPPRHDEQPPQQQEDEAAAEAAFAAMAATQQREAPRPPSPQPAPVLPRVGDVPRPGRWKVRAAWSVVAFLLLVLLVDWVHPLKPYLNPSDEEDEEEDDNGELQEQQEQRATGDDAKKHQ